MTIRALNYHFSKPTPGVTVRRATPADARKHDARIDLLREEMRLAGKDPAKPRKDTTAFFAAKRAIAVSNFAVMAKRGRLGGGKRKGGAE